MPEIITNGLNGDLKENNNLKDSKKCGKFAGKQPELNGVRHETCSKPDFGSRFIQISVNDKVRELQTKIRDKNTTRGDFVFYADRLIRHVVEEGLNQLPYEKCTVTSPSGASFEGLRFQKGNCGVSIMRNGEAMEKALRECCRSIRIGKILIRDNEVTKKPEIYYAKFPKDVSERKVLLMYPLINSGAKVIAAINVLIDHGVKEGNIILLNVFTTQNGTEKVMRQFPFLTMLTSEIHHSVPNHFGQKYFGTD